METITPFQRRYLHLAAAVTGAAVMVIEILGTRLLAPYFGSSHFVWTAQIATTLVALAAGYWAGGRLADRAPRPGVLFAFLLAAGAALALTILLLEPIATRCVELDLAVGALCASAALYFLPLAFLAMTGPFLIRLLSGAVGEVGARAGGLFALSTLGSVAGTILIGYVLIPLLSNSAILLLVAGAIGALALIHFLAWGRRAGLGKATGAFLAALALGGWGVWRDGHPAFSLVQELHRANSHFGRLQVLKRLDESRIILLDDLIAQNSYDPAARRSLSLFSYVIRTLVRAYGPEVHDVLVIGMGAGMVPMEFAREGARVDVVEINPAMVPVATRFFGFEPDRVRLTIGDGRQFLRRARGRYDVIVLDAFLGDSSPTHLLSQEAFRSMAGLLRPRGMLVMNTFAHFEGGRGFYCASVERTLRSVFTAVTIHASPRGNVFFVAVHEGELRPIERPDLQGVHAELLDEVWDTLQARLACDPASGRILTDDFNPLEFHDARNRESIRRRLLKAYLSF